ncbi:MAG TPA: hypothetical protein VE961_05025 [Pyrinomonadaceae bacterium]|nr:hypothetical protein [Pyrinomonadaceae bacterium]
MKHLLIGIAVGVALTVGFFILTTLADGACHCVKPTIVFFPYAALALSRSWSSLSLPLMALQYPLYSIVVSIIRGLRLKLVALAIFIALHILAASAGLVMNH